MFLRVRLGLVGAPGDLKAVVFGVGALHDGVGSEIAAQQRQHHNEDGQEGDVGAVVILGARFLAAAAEQRLDDAAEGAGRAAGEIDHVVNLGIGVPARRRDVGERPFLPRAAQRMRRDAEAGQDQI